MGWSWLLNLIEACIIITLYVRVRTAAVCLQTIAKLAEANMFFGQGCLPSCLLALCVSVT